MAWVKLHDDILGDPKLMRAARKGARELVYLPWLFAFASKAADHGRLSVGGGAADAEDIAYQIPGAESEDITDALAELHAIGVLEQDADGCFRFAKWEDRQAKPSSTKSAVLERVHKHRAKVKRPTKNERNAPPALQGVTEAQNGAAPVPENGTVTPCNATDKKRGEEKREEAEEKNLPADAGSNGVIVLTPPPPKDTPAAKPDPFPKPICDAGYEAYIQRVGPINYGRFRKALLPVYESKQSEHPTARQLVDAVEAFAEAMEADDPKFQSKYTLAAFTNGLRNYIRLGALPLVDEWGEATERGRMAGIGA